MGKKSVDTKQPVPTGQGLVNQQQAANTQTAVDLTRLNRIDTTSPFGNISFTGGTGPGGVFGQTQSVTLPQGAQQTLTNQQNLASALSGLGVDLAGQLGGGTQTIGSGTTKTIPDGGAGAGASAGGFIPGAFQLGSVDTSGLPGIVGSIDTAGLPSLPGIDDFSGARDQATQAFFDRGQSLLQPQFDEQNRAADNLLAQRGFKLPGSGGIAAGAPGANRELDRIGNLQNRALTDLSNSAQIFGGQEQSRMFGDALAANNQSFGQRAVGAGFQNQAQNQALNQLFALRNVPFQDLSNLQGLTPNLPSIQPNNSFFQPNQPAPNAIGAGLGAFNADLAKAQADQQAKAGFFGGLGNAIGGVAGLALPAAFPGTFGVNSSGFSDRRLKDNIEKIGTLDNGLTLYSWDWNAKALELSMNGASVFGPSYGVMADEVQQIMPQAVGESNGYMTVDYEQVMEAV